MDGESKGLRLSTRPVDELVVAILTVIIQYHGSGQWIDHETGVSGRVPRVR